MAKDTKEAKEIVLPPGVAKGVFRDNAEVICFAVILILFFKTFVGQQFTIPSASMRNTLMIGDHLLANKFLFATPQWDFEEKLFPMRKVERGDIIVFRYPMDRNLDYVKRCVAVPGDKVEVRQKRLYVNDKQITGEFEHHIVKHGEQPESGPWPLSRDAGKTVYEEASEMAKREGYVVQPHGIWPFMDPGTVEMNRQGMMPDQGGASFYFRDDISAFKVPDGQVVALGDNRDNSLDSRYWGFVPIDHLRGRPFMVWWSYREGGNDDQNAKVPDGPAGVLSNFVDAARYFFVRTRWERTGTIPR